MSDVRIISIEKTFRRTPRGDSSILLAGFTAELRGMRLSKCQILEMADGKVRVMLPPVRFRHEKINAFKIIDDDLHREFIAVAPEPTGELPDDGLVRFLGEGERESLARAGL